MAKSWTCPRDQPLWPQEFDADKRLMRYRAKPSVCNACPVRADCTSSHCRWGSGWAELDQIGHAPQETRR